MNAETARGVILRVRPLTDTSLIVHWLTAEQGRLATVAKGARKPKSANFGRLDLFFAAEFSFQRSHRSELHSLREVSVVLSYPALRDDYARLAQAAYAVALVELVTEAETPVPEIHGLFSGFLAHLDAAPAQPRTVYAFEARLLALSGLDPVESATEMAPATRDLLTDLRDADWSGLAALAPAAATVRAVQRRLSSQLEDHWGRVPRGRERAVSGASG